MKTQNPLLLDHCIGYSSRRMRIVMTCGAMLHLVALVAFGAPPSPPALTVRPALSLEFFAPAGSICTPQGSIDLLKWSDVGARIFGEGSPVRELISLETLNDPECGYVRVKVDPNAACMAPLDLAEQMLSFDAGGYTLSLELASGGNGTRTIRSIAAPITWKWHRSDREKGTLMVSALDGVTDHFDLQYAVSDKGFFKCRRVHSGIAVEMDSGVFRPLPHFTINEVVPSTMFNSKLAICTNGRLGEIKLKGTGMALEKSPYGTLTSRWTYEKLDSRRAMVVLWRDTNPWKTFTLSFGAGPLGTFDCEVLHLNAKSREIRRRVSSGTFLLEPGQ